MNSCNPASNSFCKISRIALASVAATAFVCGAHPASAQTASLTALSAPAAYSEVARASMFTLPSVASLPESSSSVTSLPDDPSAVLASSNRAEAGYAPGAPGTVAPKYKKYIPAGEQGQKIDAHDKVIIGLRDLYAPSTLLGIVITSGYEHVTNGEPNYGTNSKAFGKRVGAGALRDTTEGIFADTILAPLLHEDPRYYIEGPQYGFLHRTFYAATRPIITRTDSGRTTINGAILAGYAASSALSYTYYPQINKNFKDTAATYGTSLGGTALGFFVSEFAPDVLKTLHIHMMQ